MTRYAWWEDVRTTHTDLRAALATAARRTRDVDEDVGVVPPLSLPRSAVDGGLLMETAAMGVTVGGPYLRSHARGWEVAPGRTLDMRAFLGRRHELTDIIAEVMPGTDRLMVHVTGPWTFGASVEYHGHPLCFDRPAFRDVALALGEGVREFCDAVGASVVHVHERRFAEVTSTLVGATEFETMSVDREIATNVERRFVEQVCGGRPGADGASGADGADGAGDAERVGSAAREVVLDAGCVYPELTHTGASALVVDTLDDGVARLIDGGTAVAWRVDRAAVAAGSEAIAKHLMRTWKQWTFDGGNPEPQIDLVACSELAGGSDGGVLTPNAAAELARTVRGAAALLHRN